MRALHEAGRWRTVWELQGGDLTGHLLEALGLRASAGVV